MGGFKCFHLGILASLDCIVCKSVKSYDLINIMIWLDKIKLH